MTVTKRSINDIYYLWEKTGGSKQFVVVDAHGAPRGTTFPAPVTIGFFGREGECLWSLPHKKLNIALNDPTESSPVRSTVSDYILGKFQGYHTPASDGGVSETYDDVKNWVEETGYSVLTIRNRKSAKKGGAVLSQVATIARDQGYGEVRVLICRGSGDGNKGSLGTGIKLPGM